MALTDKSSVVIPKGFYGKANVLQGFNPQTENLVNLDVVRNTTATRVNEAGLIESVAANVPRRDFLNGGCGELLVEPQRTNLFKYSEEFDNADWSKAAAGTGSAPIVTSNTAIAPDGTTTADRIVLDVGAGTSSGDFSILQQSITVSANEYSISFYLKSATGTNQVIQLRANSTPQEEITITPEWQRFTIQNTPIAGSRNFGFDLRGNTTGGSQTADFYAWGAQLEEGSYPTSYIPTTASAVTRNQDVISASNIGSLLNDAKGGVYIDWKAFDSQTSISLNDPNLQRTGVNIAIPMTGRIEYKLEIDNVEQCNINTINNFLNVQNKTAVRYANNNFALFVDGAKIGQDNTGNTFNSGQLTELKFNSVFPADQPFFGRIRELTVFNNALTDTELQTLTTP